MFPRTSGTWQDHTPRVELIFIPLPTHISPYSCHFQRKRWRSHMTVINNWQKYPLPSHEVGNHKSWIYFLINSAALLPFMLGESLPVDTQVDCTDARRFSSVLTVRNLHHGECGCDFYCNPDTCDCKWDYQHFQGLCFFASNVGRSNSSFSILFF